jgi:hypothetical protein
MDTDLPAAASGLLAAGAHVRAAALGALPAVPTLAEGLSPGDDIVVTLAVALHDVSEANAAAAQQLWDMAECTTPHDYMGHLAVHLASLHSEVRRAASAALAAAAAQYPDTVPGALEAVIALYHQPSQQQQQEEQEANGTADGAAQNGRGRRSFEAALPLLPGELAEEADEAAAAAAAAQLEARHCSRCGCASALQALAPQLAPAQVRAALDFLIGEGLADEDDRVRELMVAAGEAGSWRGLGAQQEQELDRMVGALLDCWAVMASPQHVSSQLVAVADSQLNRAGVVLAVIVSCCSILTHLVLIHIDRYAHLPASRCCGGGCPWGCPERHHAAAV